MPISYCKTQPNLKHPWRLSVWVLVRVFEWWYPDHRHSRHRLPQKTPFLHCLCTSIWESSYWKSRCWTMEIPLTLQSLSSNQGRMSRYQPIPLCELMPLLPFARDVIYNEAWCLSTPNKRDLHNAGARRPSVATIAMCFSVSSTKLCETSVVDPPTKGNIWVYIIMVHSDWLIGQQMDENGSQWVADS